MPPTTEDPNRQCWNCKHFAPEDRETSPDGECRFYPPRYNGVVSPFFFFPAALGDEWCGKWERNAATVGDMPQRELREEREEEPTRQPSDTINMENTVTEMRDFAESNNIDLEGARLKEEIFAIIETSLEGE